MNTPWGKSDNKITYSRGISFVSTPSHGGFAITKKVAGKLLSPAAQHRGESYGGYLFFGEDTAAYIILFELVHERHPYNPAVPDVLNFPINIPTRDVVIRALSTWHADYLLERGITPDVEGLAIWNRHREEDRLREEKSPNLIVAASGDWKAGVPKGWVEVITADWKAHLVLASEYDNRSGLDLLSNFTEVKEVL